MTEEQFNMAMERIRKKDKSALKEIYDEYLGFIYNTVYHVVGHKETAEDITSEFFIRLWEKADQYKPGSGHKGYLATIARNMTIDYLRKYQKESLIDQTESESDNEMSTQEESSVSTLEEEVVETLSVEEALSRLKPLYRQIVTMKVLGDMTFKEISQVLGIPQGTVTWNYQDALKKLRRFGYE